MSVVENISRANVGHKTTKNASNKMATIAAPSPKTRKVPFNQAPA